MSPRRLLRAPTLRAPEQRSHPSLRLSRRSAHEFDRFEVLHLVLGAVPLSQRRPCASVAAMTASPPASMVGGPLRISPPPLHRSLRSHTPSPISNFLIAVCSMFQPLCCPDISPRNGRSFSCALSDQPMVFQSCRRIESVTITTTWSPPLPLIQL